MQLNDISLLLKYSALQEFFVIRCTHVCGFHICVCKLTCVYIMKCKTSCPAKSNISLPHRNAGYTEEAARVHIDSVPSVTILADADSGEGASIKLDQHTQRGLPGQSPESTVLSRESSMACKFIFVFVSCLSPHFSR